MFLFFTGRWQLNVFSSHTMVFKYVKLVKRPAQKVSNYTFFLIALEILILTFRWSRVTTFLIQVIHIFITSLDDSHSGLSESIPVSHQARQTSKEIEVDISIFLGYSVL